MNRKQYRRQFIMSAIFATLFALGLVAMGGCTRTASGLGSVSRGLGQLFEGIGTDLQQMSSNAEQNEYNSFREQQRNQR
jgi:hypothetical protein